jgi:hypothetical protein
MLFRSTILALLAAVATADSMVPDFNVPTTSKTGKRLLSKARRLENNNNNNNNNQDGGEADWLSGYSIKYDSCSSLIQMREDGNADDEEGIIYTQNLVKFIICPGNSDGCSGCGNGVAQYVVNMQEFIASYTEMKEEQKEYACEMVRENCYCENANDDDACENTCFQTAGMTECIEYEGQEEQDLNAFMECAAMEGADGNNNNNNNGNNYNNNNNNNNNNGVNMYKQYYVGPMCSQRDGKSIFLAAFNDAGCSSYAGTGVYEAFNYGYSLPYEKESIIALNDCISCLQVDQDNNNNNNNNNGNNNNYNGNYGNQEQEVSEFCQQSYEEAVKCESKLSNYVGQYYYPDERGCEFITKILPKLESATRKIAGGSSAAAAGSAATGFAVVFGLTTALLGAYAFFLYRKIHRAKVNLAQAEMNMA